MISELRSVTAISFLKQLISNLASSGRHPHGSGEEKWNQLLTLPWPWERKLALFHAGPTTSSTCRELDDIKCRERYQNSRPVFFARWRKFALLFVVPRCDLEGIFAFLAEDNEYARNRLQCWFACIPENFEQDCMAGGMSGVVRALLRSHLFQQIRNSRHPLAIY
jgi:hypothetical protein